MKRLSADNSYRYSRESGYCKRTFYYYFKSKEEVVDAVIERIIRDDIVNAKIIANNPNFAVLDKIFQIFFGQKVKAGSRKEKVIAEFNKPSNAEMRQKSLVQAVHHLSPILANVVIEGVNQGVLNTSCPQETTELLIVCGQILFDKAWFHWNDVEISARASAFVQMMEKSLGADKGSFDYMAEILIN